MKPRVAHVINSFGLGGVPQVAYQLLRSLPADTYDLYLYILKSYDDNSKARQQLSDHFKDIGVTVRCPDRDEKKFYVVSQLTSWLLSDRINILHTHSYKPNIYGRLAGLLCRQTGLKIIAHYHNYYDNKWAGGDSLIFEQQLKLSTDHFLACSASVAQHAADKIGIKQERIEILLNGIDLSRFNVSHDREAIKSELGLAGDYKLIGTVGRLCEQKAQDIFLEAAARINRSYPNTMFLIVGAADESEMLARLQAQTNALGLQDMVRFLGYVSDIPRIYSLLDILVMPSRWEGFGLALVEAMAMGLPIVATHVGGIPEVVIENETALLVPPEDVSALTQAIERLLTQPDLATAMLNAGRKRASQFDYSRIGQQAHQGYQRLLVEPYRAAV